MKQRIVHKSDPIVHASEPVTLLGGGEATECDLRDALALGPTCVAADGGASLAVAFDIALAAVIGDFDSINQADLDTIPAARQFHIAEQDSTDFDKALRHIEAPLVLAVGFSGARLDHQLAVLHVLAKYPERPCILVSPHELTFLCPPRIVLPTQAGDAVSLFSLGPVHGRSEGLEWPIDGLTFTPLEQIGTSNRATGTVVLEVDAPAMLAMVPRRLLAPLTQALVSRSEAPQHLAGAPVKSGAQWPARAERYTDPPQS